MGVPKMKILEELNESGEWKGQAFRVVFHILNYTNGVNPELFWSFRKISETLDIKRELVSDVFTKLEDLGFIRDKGGRKGRYKNVKIWEVDWDYLENEWLPKRATEEQVAPKRSTEVLSKGAHSSAEKEHTVAPKTRTNPPPLNPPNKTPIVEDPTDELLSSSLLVEMTSKPEEGPSSYVQKMLAFANSPDRVKNRKAARAISGRKG